MDLPTQAANMYNTWWSFANYAANAQNPDGSWAYTVADASAAAAEISRTVGGNYESWSPIGMSQLFSVARKLGNATNQVGAADASSPITPGMVAEAPWSRSQADQAASPQWQARMSITYTDESGVQQTGITVVNISQVLPTSVGSLTAQLQLRVQDQLSSPPGSGTPRSGSLDSIDSITLLAVLGAVRRYRSLPAAGGQDINAGRGGIPR